MSATINLSADDRITLVELVLAGKLSEDYLSDSDLVELQETVMDLIIQDKTDQGKIAFSGVFDGVLN